MAFTNDDIAMIGVRYSEDSRTRTDNDELYLVDGRYRAHLLCQLEEQTALVKLKSQTIP